MTPRLRLPTSGSASAMSLIVSAVIHGSIAAAVTVAGNHSAASDPWDEDPPSRLTLIAPANTSPPPSAAQVAAQSTRGDEGTSTATRESDRGAERAGARSIKAEGTPSDASDASNSVNVLGTDAAVSKIYQVLEVDSVAERDPSSSAPIYPEALQRRGIEGWVVAKFVVDTLGIIEPRSVVIVSTTSSSFTSAVLEAIPHMRYRPALKRGRVVRQEAEQMFRFRVAPVRASAVSQVLNP